MRTINQALSQIFFFLFVILVICFRSQNVLAQKSTIDSINTLLVYFQKNVKDVRVQKMTGDATKLLERDSINDALSITLVDLEDWLFKFSQVERKLILGYFEPVMNLIQNHPGINWRTKATGLNRLAYLYASAHDYDKVFPIYELALSITRDAIGTNNEDYADILINEASFYSDIGQPAKAIPRYQQGIQIQKNTIGENNVNYAGSMNSLALLYANSGEYLKALPLYDRSIKIYKQLKGDQDPEYASAINNLAILYETMGLYNKALTLYLQVLEIDKKTLFENDRDKAATLSNVANVYEDLGQYDQAFPLYDQALRFLERDPGRESPEYATVLDNLASLYEDLNMNKKAFDLYSQSLNIRKKVLGIHHPDYAGSLNNKANLYKKQKKYDSALLYYKEAAEIIKGTYKEKHSNYATFLQNEGNLLKDMHQFSKALPLLEQARDIRMEVLGKDHPEYAKSLGTLSVYYQARKMYLKSWAFMKDEMEIQKKVLGDGHPEYAKSLQNLAIISLFLDKQNDAINLVRKANNIQFKNIIREMSTLSEQEKMALTEAQSTDFDLLPSIIYSGNLKDSSITDQLYNNALLLKGLLLQDQENLQRLIGKSSDSLSRQIYAEWRFDKMMLGKLLLLRRSRRPSNMDSLVEATDELERDLSRRSAAFKNQLLNQSVSSNDVRGKLSKGQAAIEFIRFRLFKRKWTDSIIYAALLIKPGESVRFIRLFEERKLKALLSNKYGSDYSSLKIHQLYPGIGKFTYSHKVGPDELYKLIWKPLEINLKGTTTVFYSPVGLLNRVAFNGIRADGTHLLIDKYSLEQVLSTRSVLFSDKSNKKRKSINVWGHIKYDTPIQNRDSINSNIDDSRDAIRRGLKPLPGTLAEMDMIKVLFEKEGWEIKIDSGGRATEEEFKAMDGNSMEAMHLATHGFFLPIGGNETVDISNIIGDRSNFKIQRDPMFRSGLFLAGSKGTWEGIPNLQDKEDGILTAYEISQMDLNKTDLVVLSACETGLGDLQGNEGVFGLQRAFKIAGVRQLIMSLWKVPDKETVELMSEFYKNWLRGQTASVALREAQLRMKEKYPPYYWAGFVEIE